MERIWPEQFHPPCFVCGQPGDPALGSNYSPGSQPNSVVAEFVIEKPFEGPAGFAHGGAMFSALDEGMSTAIYVSGQGAVAFNVSIKYEKPVPLGTSLQLECRVDRTEGRKVFATGELRLPSGDVACRADGLFIIPTAK